MSFFPIFSQKPQTLLASYALFVALASPGQAAGSEDDITMKYDVYAVGVKVYKIYLNMKIREKDYATKISVRPKGFFKIFADSKVDVSSQGTIAAKSVFPRNFVMASDSNGKKRRVNVKWATGAKPQAKRNYKVNKWRAGKIDKVLHPEVTGPLTFIVRQAARLPAKPCTGSERVYTGKVVYEYKFKSLGRKVFTNDDKGEFRGQTLKCSLTMRPLAGLSAEKMKAAEKNPYPPYTIWYAPVAGTKRTSLVPVAVAGKMKGQSFEMRLKKGAIDGQPINSRAVALK
jgi:hypothetical protein